MPPPSSENDLKRRARRRLIGAVALTLLAVIVLPLLLEDEPPPASSLAVKMAALPADDPRDEPAPAQADDPVAPPPTRVTEPLASPAPRPEPEPRPVPPPPVTPKPAPQPAPAKPAPKPAPTQTQRAKPAAEMFVVQLAALSDASKAHALKGRAALAGLPAYTDKVGALTRVRVGPYPSRQAAAAASAKLAENGMPGQILTQ